MEFDSPDVEKDFPGLYSSGDRTRKTKDESDYSESDHDKISKKDLLIGRRKEKKDKKDRGYAALEGESSPEEELDAKSFSKSKKSKAFKFSSSKNKEKREKSRDKEKSDKDVRDDDKLREKERPDKEKKKERDKKEKDKKEKYKEKDKKDKKGKQPSVSDDILELGDVQPVFGVSVSLATERSRCHDGIDLPLVVRDCIDYLQENSLENEQIYKVDPAKTRLLQLKRLYNNRERQEIDDLDMSTACGLLKLFLRELPEPILTTDLIARFEEVASHSQVTKQQKELRQLVDKLPKCHKTVLSWILLHFDAVLQNEKLNKMNAQSLAMLLSPTLQMSHRLLVVLLCHCTFLFVDVQLTKYVPPITSSSPKIPEHPDDIQIELRKQESLLAQIHSEMNAGFVSKKREEQLWEVQRIITQLKRKLRSFEKKQDKSADELQAVSSSDATFVPRVVDTNSTVASTTVTHTKLSLSDDDSIKTITESAVVTETTPPQEIPDPPSRIQEDKEDDTSIKQMTPDQEEIVDKADNDQLYIDGEIGFLMLPSSHPEYKNLIQLQLKHQKLLAWKEQLQTRISSERAEILRLKQLHQQQLQNNVNSSLAVATVDENIVDADYEKIIENYIRENTLLDHKKNILAKEIFEEKKDLISLQVELAMQKF